MLLCSAIFYGHVSMISLGSYTVIRMFLQVNPIILNPCGEPAEDGRGEQPECVLL